MHHLSTVRASVHSLGCDAGYVGIDLFTRDERFVTLQTDANELRHVLRTTPTNLIRVVDIGGKGEWLALIAGWPSPWHAFRITLNEVAKDEEVRLHARVGLACVPEAFVDGTSALVKVSPWVLVRGPAHAACKPITAQIDPEGSGEALAGEVRLPRGTTLESPRDQVLFRLERVVSQREVSVA